MFWGEYRHHLDTKGRLIIPAPYRAMLKQGAMLTRGVDSHLVIYPDTMWRSVSEQLNQYPLTHATGRALRRLMFSGAVEIEIDKQGRMLVPLYLREYAALNNDALLIGMQTCVEIWQPARWQQALSNVSMQLSGLADEAKQR
jgi:MraZ protein